MAWWHSLLSGGRPSEFFEGDAPKQQPVVDPYRDAPALTLLPEIGSFFQDVGRDVLTAAEYPFVSDEFFLAGAGSHEGAQYHLDEQAKLRGKYRTGDHPNIDKALGDIIQAIVHPDILGTLNEPTMQYNLQYLPALGTLASTGLRTMGRLANSINPDTTITSTPNMFGGQQQGMVDISPPDSGKPNYEIDSNGNLVGYKVMGVDDTGRLVSGADSRQSFFGNVGEDIEMGGQGVFLSNDPQYVADYYGGLADEEVLLKLGFSEDDVKFGNLTDREPETGVSRAKILERTPLVEGELPESFFGGNQTALDEVDWGKEKGIINVLTGEDFDVKLATPVSTAIPSAAQQYRQGIDAHVRGDLLVNSADLSPDKKEALANIYRDYPALRNIDPLDADAALDEASEFMANNLDFVLDIMPDKWMEKSQDWYNGFNRIAQSAARDHNVSQEQSTGVIAALSPQTDWNVNLSRADRIMDTWNTRQDFPWSQAMDEVMPKLNKSISEKRYKDKLPNIVGKRLIDLEDPAEKAMWIRAYDEAHNPREFHLYNPDGTQGRIATKQDGTPREANWASTNTIEKSVRMLMDGSRRNISEQVGEGHKVRSFFRNAADPTEPTTTTMDTHAVAAALLRPLSAKSEEVGQNFGSVVKDAVTGMKGTYPINQDAYNRVARRHGVEGRTIQSPTWEFVREMMEGQKGQIAGQPKGVVMDDYVKRLWEAYEDGRMSQRSVQEAIVKAFGVPKTPY